MVNSFFLSHGNAGIFDSCLVLSKKRACREGSLDLGRLQSFSMFCDGMRVEILMEGLYAQMMSKLVRGRKSISTQSLRKKESATVGAPCHIGL